ncbi:MAG: hypothetical protein JWO73_927 [Candidatus Taylorbacteria bacterium]|nr:hypothetical protein [Candidatus Taylorbacteria bacterium]
MMISFNGFQAFLLFLGTVIPLSCLLYFMIALLFEIPEWNRSRKLSLLAKKYDLTFLRSKRGWRNGWLSLQNGQSNFISGKIGPFVVDFHDYLLVEGNLGLGFKPSIAEVSNKWNLSGTGGTAFTRKVSMLNSKFYRKLPLKVLTEVFEKISAQASDKEVQEMLSDLDFTKHIMRNWSKAAFISGFVAIFSLFVASLASPDFPDYSIIAIIAFNAFLNIPLLLWTSKKYGKQFLPADINQYPQMEV